MKHGVQKQYYKRLEMILSLDIAEAQEDLCMEVPVSTVARWYGVKEKDIMNIRMLAFGMSPLRIVTEMIEKIEEREEEQSPYVNGATLATVEEFGNLFVQLLALKGPKKAVKRIFKVVGAKEGEEKNVFKELFMEYARRFILRMHAMMHEFSYPFEFYDAVWFKGTVTEERFKGMVCWYGIK